MPTDPTASQALMEQGLLLWRGRPFADLGDEAFVEVESRRLEGRHLLARRTLAESRIAQGRYADVIGDLEAMAAEHPLEEAVVQLLMTALHRSGRTADALRAYGDLRMRLGSELGIEPSGQLRQLEQQLSRWRRARRPLRPCSTGPTPHGAGWAICRSGWRHTSAWCMRCRRRSARSGG